MRVISLILTAISCPACFVSHLSVSTHTNTVINYAEFSQHNAVSYSDVQEYGEAVVAQVP
jgi:hypothetical protein